MIHWLKKLFGAPAKPAAAIPQGALIIDVREQGEFASGHAAGAINIPLGQLASRIDWLKQQKPPALLLYCASGMRSAMACKQLQSAGFANVQNAGNQARLAALLNRQRQAA